MAHQDDEIAANLRWRPKAGFSRQPAAEQADEDAACVSRELRQKLVERLAALRYPGEADGRVVNPLKSNASRCQRAGMDIVSPGLSRHSNIRRWRGTRPS